MIKEHSMVTNRLKTVPYPGTVRMLNCLFPPVVHGKLLFQLIITEVGVQLVSVSVVDYDPCSLYTVWYLGGEGVFVFRFTYERAELCSPTFQPPPIFAQKRKQSSQLWPYI